MPESDDARDGNWAEPLERLCEALEAHLEHHRRLLRAMQAKRAAAAAARPDDMEAAVEEERFVIERIGESERERIDATREVSRAMGSPMRLRLLDIIQLAGEDHRDRLLDLREDLLDVADSLERLNRLNRTLVLRSLERTRLFVALLRPSPLFSS